MLCTALAFGSGRVEMPELDIADRVFLKSFAKLAMCFGVQSSLVKDRANWPAGDFDSIPATELFCLATAAAAEIGIVERSFAEETLKAVHDRVSLIARAHGSLPHFVRRMEGGQYRIYANTEFSTVDTAIFQISMLLSAAMPGRSEIAAEVTGQIRESALAGFTTLMVQSRTGFATAERQYWNLPGTTGAGRRLWCG